MPVPIHEILGVLGEYGVQPVQMDVDFPEIGSIQEGETVYTTSVTEVFREPQDGDAPEWAVVGDGRLQQVLEEVRRISEMGPGSLWQGREGISEPPEPHCAWYCPIHFFGWSWGIFLREQCIIQFAVEIAHFVEWDAVPKPISLKLLQQLLRAAFYALYLHEHFHHKVESLGFRLLVGTGADRYRPYKTRVYRPAFGTAACLEESLANAESYRRLNEKRYVEKVDQPIRSALRRFLMASFRAQPPGYAEAVRFLGERRYRSGLYELQSQILDARRPPTTPVHHWSIAPNVITSLMDISDDIYVVLPIGARPIFRATSIEPGYTTSTRELVGALTKYYGYTLAGGGKGSHIKLTKPGAPNIHVPGNRPVLSHGVVKQALNAIGGYSLSSLREVLDGKLKGLPTHAQMELEQSF